MTNLAQFAVVRLLTDRYRERGLENGALGTILEVYEDAYEVEFSQPDGITIDWFPVRMDEVELAPSVETVAPVRRAR